MHSVCMLRKWNVQVHIKHSNDEVKCTTDKQDKQQLDFIALRRWVRIAGYCNQNHKLDELQLIIINSCS